MTKVSTLTTIQFVTLLLAPPAVAVDRLNASEHPCASIHERIESEGAIIVRYPSSRPIGLTLYDRYVAGAYMCGSDDGLVNVTVPAHDGMCTLTACQHQSHSNDR